MVCFFSRTAPAECKAILSRGARGESVVNNYGGDTLGRVGSGLRDPKFASSDYRIMPNLINYRGDPTPKAALPNLFLSSLRIRLFLANYRSLQSCVLCMERKQVKVVKMYVVAGIVGWTGG